MNRNHQYHGDPNRFKYLDAQGLLSRMGKQKQPRSGGSNVLSVPTEMRKRGKALFEQQMWCWGCDVRREAGNLLLQYGMEKLPSPETRYHSAYRCVLEAGSLTLWGWGLWAAIQDYGSIFISRSCFRVRYSSTLELQPNAWCEAQLPPIFTPQSEVNRAKSDHLLTTVFHWIADYECWLASLVEPNYRERTLATWTQRRRYRGGIPISEVSNQWTQLAQMTASATLN